MKKRNREYYKKNRVKICKKQIDVYMPNTIKKIGELVSDEILVLYDQYPFEMYETYLRAKLKACGLRQNNLAFDECYEAAMVGYMYSIHRCAYMHYSHVEYYIKFMIQQCITIGLMLANQMQYDLK